MPQYHERSSSRYVDYTSEEGGRGAYADGYSSFEGGYAGPPDRPPRRGKSSEDRDRSINSSLEHRMKKNRSLEQGLDARDSSYDMSDRHDRSLDRLDRRDRSLERLDRRDRSLERLNRHERSLDRIDRRDRSMERLHRQDRSLERLDRRDRDLEVGLDTRERSVEQNTDRRNKSLQRGIGRRERSLERLDRNERSAELVNERSRDHDYSLDRRERSMDRLNGSDRNDSRNDRRHKSRSREQLADDYPNQVYLHPGSAMAPSHSDRADSEYTIRNEATRTRAIEEEERRAASRAASEIYASTRFPRPQSEMSQYTYRSGRHGSDVVSVKTKSTANGKLVMETMTAPHPCCPNTRSCCCLMILLNLGLLLITLGFVVVLQLYDPPFVWYVGLSMLIFGFLVLFGSLIYCVFVCREVERLRPPPGELYWTKHWSKTIHVPEIHYSNNQTRPAADYRGSEFSFKTDPSRVTNGHNTNSSLTRY